MVSGCEARKRQAEIRRKADAHKLDKEDVMVSHEERQKLLRDYQDEPVRRIGVLVKCAAGLLIVTGIAVVGLTTAPQADVPAGAISATEFAPRQEQEHAPASRAPEESPALTVSAPAKAAN